MKTKTRKTQAERLHVVKSEPTWAERMLEQHGDAPDNFNDPRLADEDGTLLSEKLAPKTVVKVVYKHRYQDQAKARGATDKASRRGNGDWLQRELQAECNDKKGNFNLDHFEAILAANGVDSSRWNRTTRGWEGRVRMSGSLVLRGVVGKSGVLRTPTGTTNVVEIAEGGDDLAKAFLAKWSN
jgi:hypothetical protein